jgi:hypothetical protein
MASDGQSYNNDMCALLGMDSWLSLRGNVPEYVR